MTVTFDWDGSLALARSLWSLAEDLDGAALQRRTEADVALATWEGRFAKEFVARIDLEQQQAPAIAAQLRAEADGWAIEWQRAMDQENWHRYTAAVDRAKAGRGFFDKVGDALFGNDDPVPGEPRPAGRPSAPSFSPTRQFANYSRW